MKVGLTGNIGSGKSTAARIFSALGIPVFYADQQAKQLYQDPEVIREVKRLFGDVTDADGKVVFQHLAKIVFSDPEKLRQLNALIHPRVREKYYSWLKLHKEQPYTIQEAAIMVKSGLYKQMDAVVVITAPENQRIQRILGRDDATEEEVRKRMKQQLPEEKLVEIADFVVKNDEQTLLIPQILDIHKILIKQSADF